MKEKRFQDSMKRWITSGLFKEIAQNTNYVIYTLKEARESFISFNDPTGYLYSRAKLGGYAHWVALKESPAVAPQIAAWEEELEVKLRAEALEAIHKLSKGDKGYQAAKFLVDGGWKEKVSGRPTRDKIKKESRIRSKMYDEFELQSVK